MCVFSLPLITRNISWFWSLFFKYTSWIVFWDTLCESFYREYLHMRLNLSSHDCWSSKLQVSLRGWRRSWYISMMRMCLSTILTKNLYRTVLCKEHQPWVLALWSYLELRPQCMQVVLIASIIDCESILWLFYQSRSMTKHAVSTTYSCDNTSHPNVSIWHYTTRAFSWDTCINVFK